MVVVGVLAWEGVQETLVIREAINKGVSPAQLVHNNCSGNIDRV